MTGAALSHAATAVSTAQRALIAACLHLEQANSDCLVRYFVLPDLIEETTATAAVLQEAADSFARREAARRLREAAA